jgi:uncharacterized protein YebE (UPF0316 family)
MKMIDMIIRFFTAVPLWELILILLSKSIEVSIGTLRVILISKGYKRQGAFISFFEVLLWVMITSIVITGIAEAPIKAITYSLGFALGVYMGSKIEAFLAFGKVLLYVICDHCTTCEMEKMIREAGFGVTSLDAHGKDSDKSVLMIFANRKGKDELVELIKKHNEKAMIVTNEVSILTGGYITPWRRIAK